MHVVGVGDFNRDGKADIVWPNYSTGVNGIWVMNGFRISDAVPIQGIGDLNGQVAAVGGLVGNGRSEFLWYNMQTGQRGMWFFNEFSYGLDLDYCSTLPQNSSPFMDDGGGVWRF